MSTIFRYSLLKNKMKIKKLLKGQCVAFVYITLVLELSSN